MSIICWLPCKYQVSHFLAYAGEGRGREILLLFSIVNRGNKGAAKRKLHRNKISSSTLSLSLSSPLALQVSCYVFFDYTAYLDTISNRLSLRINLSPPPLKISKGFLLQNFIVTFQYRISSSFQDGV